MNILTAPNGHILRTSAGHLLRPRINIVMANSKYGLLYNWYAASDSRGFVAGWHVSTTDDVSILSEYLGGMTYSGGKLKEIGLIYWEDSNTDATNEVGFNGRGSGQRIDTEFNGFRIDCYFWQPNDPDGEIGRRWGFTKNIESFVNWGWSPKYIGSPIRLVCDSTTDPGFVDIDGKRYLTVKIGDQVWMAENLQATHFANGDAISEVTDSTAWAALTTPGLCAYNNSWDNV